MTEFRKYEARLFIFLPAVRLNSAVLSFLLSLLPCHLSVPKKYAAYPYDTDARSNFLDTKAASYKFDEQRSTPSWTACVVQKLKFLLCIDRNIAPLNKTRHLASENVSKFLIPTAELKYERLILNQKRPSWFVDNLRFWCLFNSEFFQYLSHHKDHFLLGKSSPHTVPWSCAER